MSLCLCLYVCLHSAISQYALLVYPGMLPSAPDAKSYGGWKYYVNSKLANVHFTTTLARELAAHRYGKVVKMDTLNCKI